MDKFETILLPAILETEAYLEGEEAKFSGLELFDRLALLPHQCAILSTVTRKIRARRRFETVFGYGSEFTHRDFTSGRFNHEDDLEAFLQFIKMALYNELKTRPGRMKNEYSFYTRVKHKNGNIHMVRIGISTFNSILGGVPIEALFVFSDFGKAEFQFPRGLVINKLGSLIQRKDESDITRSDIPFTKREREVLYGICMGESSKMIADRFDIAKKTVDNMRAKLLEKSGTANTAELASKAVLYSWV